jgi:hypothetical protein
MAEKLESLLDDRDQVKVVRLNEQVRDFAKSEDGNGIKDTYNKQFFPKEHSGETRIFHMQPVCIHQSFLGKL